MDDTDNLYNELYDKLVPTVCLDHYRFIPCRRCDGIFFDRYSSEPNDVKAVGEFQGMKDNDFATEGVLELCKKHRSDVVRMLADEVEYSRQRIKELEDGKE